MPESPQSTPHPTAARVIPFTDFDEARAMFSNWQGRFEQLSAGHFEGALRVVRGTSVRVMMVTGNQRVLLRGRDAGGMISVYPVIAGNAASVWQGHRLTLGQLVVHGTDAEADHCSARQTEHLGLSIRPEELEEAARSLLNSDEAGLSRTWAVHSPPPDAFSGFNLQLARLLGAGVADPSLLETPEGYQLEQECVRSLVAALFSTVAPQSDLSPPARSRMLGRAEEFMRAHLGDPIGAIDLCRELGVSDRTLRLAFRERYGLGPMVFYKYLRLNAVRSRLKATPLIAVAEVAREFGFHHLGNFASDYHKLFGELPSETRG